MFALRRSTHCVVLSKQPSLRKALHGAAAGSGMTCSCCGLPSWVAHPHGAQASRHQLNSFISRQHQKILSAGAAPSSSSFQQHRPLITSFGSPLSSDDDSDDPHCMVDVLLRNNKKWVADSVKNDPEFLTKLAAPQKPRYLYIGCSDSRVPANEILGLGPGEVFVHRNVGNQIPGNDLNVLSVLEYAVGTLNIQDILVVGHYDCGAVRAAETRQDLGTLENWLRLIRDVHRLHKETLSHISDEETRHRALVELNVVEQCLNLYKIGVIQRNRINSENEMIAQGKDPKKHAADITPRIHGMVFNFNDGVLKSIPVDFEHRVGSLDHIYGLY